MKKCLKFFCTLLCAIIFASCSWFNNDPVQPLPIPLFPQLNTFTITGSLTTNGAMPENYAMAMNSRTALATAPEGQTIQYKVLLLAASGATTPIAGASSESDGTSYTIKYTGTDTTAVAYWLRAVAYYMDGSDEVDILVSPDTQLETAVDLKGGVFTKDLEMRPATTGYGSASLTITLVSATMCDSVTISDTTHFQVAKSGATVTITHKAAAVDNPKVACGSYPVTVNFYKTQSVNSVDTDVLVYQFDDVINIFNNLTTTVWVDNGNSPHLTTNAGVTTCNITDAKLLDFNRTNFYVYQSWTGEEKGTFAEPFKSVRYALQYIEAVGNNTSTYSIHIRATGPQDNENCSSVTINITKKIKIEVYDNASKPGMKDGLYYITSLGGNFNFTVAEGAVLTLESNGQTTYVNGASGATNGFGLKNCGGFVVSGKVIMHGGFLFKQASWWSGSLIKLNNPNAVFEMYGGSITGAQATPGSGYTYKGVLIESGTFKVAKKPYITDNDINVSLPAGKTIQVVGPLEEGALIGVTTADPPTADHPVTITTGYGYQTGGYNAGQLPGKYFRGDQYGVTQDGDPDSGEAVLKLSGGSLTTKIRDDITIDIDHTNASNNAADRKFTFTVTKDKGAVAPATSTDLTSAQGISYSYKLKDHTDTVVNPASPATPYYNTSANTLTFNTNLPGEKYKLEVEVTWQGNKYQSEFNVSYLKVDVPSGCVAVMGDSWNSSTTLCAGDTDRQSNLFIAGRHLEIPNIIASDHEVTQTEFEQYMTYDPDLPASNKPSETGTDKDKYPVYFVDWYATIIYCNLRTLGDSTFGNTREERLTHCVYSLNGTKDPELWLNSLISGTRICKTADNKFYYEYYYKYTPSSSQTPTTVLDTTATSGYQFDLNADGWRLPTAVEREYLARGGNLLPENQTIYSGTNSLEEITSTSGTIEIKQTIPNNLKLYDMSSNLKEWLWDRTNDALDVQSNTPITGKMAGNKRCKSMPQINGHQPTFPNRGYQYNEIGFRVIRTVIQ